MQAKTRKNDAQKYLALTGPPAYAEAGLIPVFIKTVLLPAIFEPVIIAILLSVPSSKSLLTFRSQGINGCPSSLPTNAASAGWPAARNWGMQYSRCSHAR